MHLFAMHGHILLGLIQLVLSVYLVHAYMFLKEAYSLDITVIAVILGLLGLYSAYCGIGNMVIAFMAKVFL